MAATIVPTAPTQRHVPFLQMHFAHLVNEDKYPPAISVARENTARPNAIHTAVVIVGSKPFANTIPVTAARIMLITTPTAPQGLQVLSQLFHQS